MFSFLGFILIFVLIIIFFGLSIIGSVLRTLFGFGRRSSSTNNGSAENRSNQSQRNKRADNASSKRKKIFEEDEGEYVEFEEVKKDKE